MRVKIFIISGYLIFCIVAVCTAQQEEKLTITTYYPSPTGVYNKLLTQTLGVGDTNNSGGLDVNDAPNPATNPGDVWIKGNVGIGTTAPDTNLTILTPVGTPATFRVEQDQSAGGGSNFYITSLEDRSVVGTATPTSLEIRTNNTVRMFINNETGNVGIGTTTPTAPLTIKYDDNNWGSGLVINNTNAGAQAESSMYFYQGPTTRGGVGAWNGRMGLWTNQAFPLDFSTNNTERMRITADGNVGIGTQTPLTRLHVEYNDNTRSNGIYVRNPNTGAQAQGKVTVCQGNPAKCGVLAIDNAKFQLWSDANLPLSFVTNNIEAIYVRPNGRVGIGTSSPDQRLHVVGNSKTSAVIAADGDYYRNDWPSDWGGGLGTWDISCASVYYDGYAQRSDKRLKKDVVSVEASAVDNLLKLRPVVYRWKDTARKGDRTHYGFIAQEVEEVFPELVLESSDEKKMKSIATDELIAVLTKAAQEQQKQIDALTREIEVLKAKK